MYNVQCIMDCLPVSVSTEQVYSDDQFAHSYSNPYKQYISANGTLYQHLPIQRFSAEKHFHQISTTSYIYKLCDKYLIVVDYAQQQITFFFQIENWARWPGMVVIELLLA